MTGPLATARRRLSAWTSLTIACAVLLLAVAPAAFALHGGVPARTQALIAAARGAHVGRSRTAGYVPLASSLAATVTATVLHYDGSPFAAGSGRLSSAPYGERSAVVAYATPDATGVLTFAGMPVATLGELAFQAEPADGDLAMGRERLTWPEAGADLGTLRPGIVRTHLTAGGPWARYSSYVYVTCSNADYGTMRWAQTGASRAGSEQLVRAYALPAPRTTVQAYFFNNEGGEDEVSTAVSAGSESFDTASINERDARRIMNPTWASGKPGYSTTLMFNNFPLGAFEAITGDDLATALPDNRTVGSWKSGGKQWQSTPVKIPFSAKPGYTYLLWVHDISGGGVDLCEPYQVCTLARSATTVRAGGSVKLSGVVPFVSGRSKKVLLYRRTTQSGQPQQAGGFASSKGWTKIATATTDGSGRYAFPRQRPKQTSWYCVWYPKDSVHWAAWTSVEKVTRR